MTAGEIFSAAELREAAGFPAGTPDAPAAGKGSERQRAGAPPGGPPGRGKQPERSEDR